MPEPKADKPAKEKTVEMFYANKGENAKGPKVQLFKNVDTDAPRAPAVTGKIGSRLVAGFVRKGAKGGFLSLVARKKGEDGKNEQLFTGNLVVTDRGAMRLAIKPAGGTEATVFASVSPKVSTEFLVSVGLDPEKLVAKRAEAAAKAAAKPAKEKAPAPKP